MLMFAGIGAFGIAIAKKADIQKIFAVEINPEAIEFMKYNSHINIIFF